MRRSAPSALLIIVRTLVAAVCVALVVAARTTVGWGNLAVMLAALAGLVAVLASYNRRYR